MRETADAVDPRRPCELYRVAIADVDRIAGAITLNEHETTRKMGQARRIPIGSKLAYCLWLSHSNTGSPVNFHPLYSHAKRGAGESRTLAGRIRGYATRPGCQKIWCCTWLATNAGQRFAGRRELNTHAGCSASRT